MTVYDIYTVGTAEYKRVFWDKAMRAAEPLMRSCRADIHCMTHSSCRLTATKKFQEALRKESIFRQLATCISALQSEGSI